MNWLIQNHPYLFASLWILTLIAICDVAGSIWGASDED